MSKNKEPSYYLEGKKYVALNRHARKMFKKAGIIYYTPEQINMMKSLLELSKKKGNKDEKDDKSKR